MLQKILSNLIVLRRQLHLLLTWVRCLPFWVTICLTDDTGVDLVHLGHSFLRSNQISAICNIRIIEGPRELLNHLLLDHLRKVGVRIDTF